MLQPKASELVKQELVSDESEDEDLGIFELFNRIIIKLVIFI
jgi:hypothetical protein